MTKAEVTGLRLGRGACMRDVMVIAIGWCFALSFEVGDGSGRGAR
jgi:hypothetical protein